MLSHKNISIDFNHQPFKGLDVNLFRVNGFPNHEYRESDRQHNVGKYLQTKSGDFDLSSIVAMRPFTKKLNEFPDAIPGLDLPVSLIGIETNILNQKNRPQNLLSKVMLADFHVLKKFYPHLLKLVKKEDHFYIFRFGFVTVV